MVERDKSMRKRALEFSTKEPISPVKRSPMYSAKEPISHAGNEP